MSEQRDVFIPTHTAPTHIFNDEYDILQTIIENALRSEEGDAVLAMALLASAAYVLENRAALEGDMRDMLIAAGRIVPIPGAKGMTDRGIDLLRTIYGDPEANQQWFEAYTGQRG